MPIMEIGTEEACIIEMPTMGTMQIAGSTGFGHNFELIPQACHLQDSSSEAKTESSSHCMPITGPLPIYLKFEDVEYRIECNPNASTSSARGMVSTRQSRHKQILKGITGSISPGEVLALMGPSGSGKTTLLKTIGGHLQGNIRGKVTYNDVPYSTALKRRIGFVPQEDVLFPQLTVEETLVFAAFLRLLGSMNRQQKLKRAEFILRELGLERCRHTRIGGAFVKGISGGERKRTTIGYEILVDPSLLLLDEPTSGLDSTSANKLLQVLQDIAKVGRTIIITIHQPSSPVYVFPFEKEYLVEERKADMYRLSVYYICSTLCDMVIHILYPTLFMAILYFMVGLRRTVSYFFFTLLTMLLIVITSQGAGELFGAAVLSIKRAGVFASLVLMLFLLTGGYYVQHIPKFMQWLKYISFVHYGFRLLLKVQYSGDLLYECGSAGGCKRLQTSPSFDTIDLNGSTQVWALLSMAIAYRLCASACLLKRISGSLV